MKIAIFDFDGTLLEGNSWQLLYWSRLQNEWRHRLSLSAALAARTARVASARWLKNRTLYSFNAYSPEGFKVWADNFYLNVLRPRLRPKGLKELDCKRKQGYRPLLATGAFDFVVAPFARELQIDLVVSTETSGKQMPPTIVGEECRGGVKHARVRSALNDLGASWQDCVAYSDNADDLPLLAAVGQGFFVGPVGHSGITALDWTLAQSEATP
jgi:alcohol-forming fatty acyl-CoA reductase